MMYCGPLFARKHDVFLCVAACLILSRWLLSFSLTATKTNIVYKRLPKESGFALQSQNISARGSNDSFSRTLQKKQNRTLNEVTEITQRNSLPKDAEDEEQEKKRKQQQPPKCPASQNKHQPATKTTNKKSHKRW